MSHVEFVRFLNLSDISINLFVFFFCCRNNLMWFLLILIPRFCVFFYFRNMSLPPTFHHHMISYESRIVFRNSDIEVQACLVITRITKIRIVFAITTHCSRLLVMVDVIHVGESCSQNQKKNVNFTPTKAPVYIFFDLLAHCFYGFFDSLCCQHFVFLSICSIDGDFWFINFLFLFSIQN